MDGVKLAVAGLPQEAVLGLDGHQVVVSNIVRLGVDFLREADVEVTDRWLLDLAPSQAGLAEEADPTNSLIIGILDPDIERKTIFSEGVELVEQLVSALRDREEVAKELQVVGLALEDLHVPALGDLVEVLLVLQGLVLLIVRHAEHPHPRLQQLVPLCEHAEPEKQKMVFFYCQFQDFRIMRNRCHFLEEVEVYFNSLCHERHMDGLFVEAGCHLGGLGHVAAVHQPEPGAHGGGEVDAVIDEGERSAAGDILPLGPGGAA